MAKEKPDYSENKEILDIAQKFIQKYPDKFDGIEVDKIVGYSITNKKRCEGKSVGKALEVQVSPDALLLTNSKWWAFVVYEDDWNEREDGRKNRLIQSGLHRLDPENPCKLQTFDHKDQSVMLRTYGVDWDEKADAPDPLKDRVDFVD